MALLDPLPVQENGESWRTGVFDLTADSADRLLDRNDLRIGRETVPYVEDQVSIVQYLLVQGVASLHERWVLGESATGP